jgi:hypothetical protein
MNIPLNETEIRRIVDGLKTKDPDITNDNLKKRVRGSLESQGFQWNEDLERKIRYCVHINLN